MKRDFYNENFEWFLRRHADDYKMQPSEKLWSQISKELSRRRRKIHLSLALMFLLTSTLGYYFITHSLKPLPEHTAIETRAPAKTYEPELAPPVKNTTPAAIKPAHIIQPIPEKKASIAKAESKTSITEPGTEASANFSQNNPALITEASATEVLRERNLTAEPTTIQAPQLNISLPEGLTAAAENFSSHELTAATPVVAHQQQEPPYTIESVVSTGINKRRFDWQLSFTPTISYRKLGENKSYLRTAASLSASSGFSPLYSVKNAVTHKPDLGFEIGLATKYSLTKNIRLIGGFQFNINRYDIKAFNAPYSVATIRLNEGNRVSSVNTITGLSNTTGYNTNWLKNFYFQASAPIGVELKLAGSNKVQFGLATSVQPSYVLGDRAYLITSDYKNYVQMPWLIRRWNANTNLQTFVNYSTGNMRWQVGPQVRYQLLSSFVSKYPVKENLFDFGLKVGVMLNQQ